MKYRVGDVIVAADDSEPCEGTVVIDDDGDAWQRRAHGYWFGAWAVSDGSDWSSVLQDRPLKVVWTP